MPSLRIFTSRPAAYVRTVRAKSFYLEGSVPKKLWMKCRRCFRKHRVERLDRDSTKQAHELESILERFRKKETDILIGNQMIVKGHDFPGNHTGGRPLWRFVAALS